MMSKATVKVMFSYKDKKPDYEVNMDLNLARFAKQTEKAQYHLDTMVMQSMVPYMPKQTGTFINTTMAMSAALAGTGEVVAAAPPMGRFLYEGKAMVGERTKSAFAAKGERKIATTKNLNYSKHANPNVTDHWFEEAKKRHADEWIRRTKKTAGGD